MKSFIPKKLRPDVAGSNVSLSLEPESIVELLENLSLREILQLDKRHNIALKIISNARILTDGTNTDSALLDQLKKIFV